MMPGMASDTSPGSRRSLLATPTRRRITISHEIAVSISAEAPAEARHHQLEHASRIRLVNDTVKNAMMVSTPVSQ